MAALTSRPFAGDGDLRALQRLAQEIWQRDPARVEWTVGELAWSAKQHDGQEDEWRRQLWSSGERLVAWGWIRLPGDLEWQVDLEHPELLETVLDWFEETATGERVETMARSGSAPAIEALRRRGYRHDPSGPWMRLNGRDLDTIEEPVVPAGYVLRTVRGPDEIPARVVVHRSSWPGSRVSKTSYADVMETWPYTPGLDCVVEAPGGRLVASALCWYDDLNRVGELEPVGTAVTDRRRGFARAVSLFALQRLREHGAEQALVASRGDAGYPVPSLLYESIGFREIGRHLPFVRDR